MFEKIDFKKLPYKKSELPTQANKEFCLPAITCQTSNQGISCYVPKKGASIFKNMISVAANGDAPAFYQPQEFTILQDAYVLKFKGNNLNSLQYLYMTALLQKVLIKFNWNNKSGWEKVKQEYITLPIHPCGENNYKIAFDFMESFIKELEVERLEELEVERLEELEAYLRVSGLKDYKLTELEEQTLNDFIALNNEHSNGGGDVNSLPSLEDYLSYGSSILDTHQEAFINHALSCITANALKSLDITKWQDFSIGDLFDIDTPKKRFDANKIKFGGIYPYIARGESNNGVRGYITQDTQFLNPANTISFGQDTATMFYQEKAYFTGDKIKIFTFKKTDLNRYRAHFLIASMKKAFINFSWGSSSYSVDNLRKIKFLLPIDSKKQPDFTFMESFIKEIEKQHFLSLIAYYHREIKTYKSIVGGGGNI